MLGCVLAWRLSFIATSALPVVLWLNANRRAWLPCLDYVDSTAERAAV